MVSLDISIVFFTLVIGLLLTVFGKALDEWLLYLLSGIYGIMIIAYFGSNYDLIVIGTFTISFYPVFTLAYFFLCIITPLVLLFRAKFD